MSFPQKIVCVSNYVVTLTEKHADKSKISGVNLGVDVDKLKPTKRNKDFKKKLGLKNERILLSVCGLVERKGIHIVIKSLPLVVKSYPNIKYFVIGRGSEKERL